MYMFIQCRPPAGGSRGKGISAQREFEDDVKRKRWTGAERPMNLDISFMAELFGRSGRGEIGSVKFALAAVICTLTYTSTTATVG